MGHDNKSYSAVQGTDQSFKIAVIKGSGEHFFIFFG